MAGKLRFGIVGCGVIGPFHAEALKSLETAELAAVADIIPERAQAVAEKYGVDWYASYEELLARSDIDVISVCTPSGLHADHGIMAARAGKHVLSEKPLDVYLEKAEELIKVCKECGVTLGGIFQNRFTKAGITAKRIIDEGWLGEIVFANASCLWYRKQAYYDSEEWRGTWVLDGGALSNQGIHTIDRLLWLTGMQPEVLAAYCPTLGHEMEAEDLGVALLKYPNGAGGVVQGTTDANPGMNLNVTICGTKGSIEITNNEITFLRVENEPEGGLLGEETGAGVGSAANDPAAIGYGGHISNIGEFVNAINEGREPSVSADEGRKAVKLLNDIYKAAGVGPWRKAECRM
ncbi:MAG: Gfo/Idh/MocA family protein [Armatimonadota bacterium]